MIRSMTGLLSPKPILKADAKTCAVLLAYFQSHSLSDFCEFDIDPAQPNTVQLLNRSYPRPVRLGDLMDAVQSFVKNANEESNAPNFLNFSGGKLDISHGTFLRPDLGETIRLTEKEVAILIFLHANKGRLVARKNLLAAVWEYAETVETHTLETHIYRLRQKIEKDPSNPTILFTQENGYRVD
jgi:DNA-binding response OmpR family regulator